MEPFEEFKKILETAGFSPVINIDADVNYIVTNFYLKFFDIMSKNDTIFDEDHILMGVNLSEVFKSEKIDKEVFWKHLTTIIFASLVHGDFKTKIKPLIAVAKQYFFNNEEEDSEIAQVLKNDTIEEQLTDLLDIILQTQIVKVCTSIVEKIDMTDLDMNFEKPEEFINSIKELTPESPKVKKLLAKFKNILEDKVKRGEITQARLQSEVELIKAKFTSIFGNIFMNALGGGNGGVKSADLMGNSPEARRQRMLARLQKKHREKNSQ
jgi:glutamyl/glutaminyl-tRNA synthetase